MEAAIEKNDIKQVRKIIRKDPNILKIRFEDKYGVSVLHLATQHGHVKIAKHFIKKGIDIDTKDALGCTALHIASTAGNFTMVKFLLQHGADITALCGNGTNVLHAASFGSNVEMINFFLNIGIHVDTKNYHLSTPLFFACGNSTWQWNFNQYRAVEFLIQNGANVNIRNVNGTSPLHAASEGGSINIINNLIKHGSNISALDNNGNHSFHVAAQYGRVQVIEFWIQKRLDVNITNNNLYTPLHFACRYNHHKAAKLLILKGADINATNKKGCTPLHVASSEGDIRLIEMLCEYGTDINAVNVMGHTALCYALFNKEINAAKVLIKIGLDQAIKDNCGKTAYNHALEQGLLNLIPELEEHAGVQNDPIKEDYAMIVLQAEQLKLQKEFENVSLEKKMADNNLKTWEERIYFINNAIEIKESALAKSVVSIRQADKIARRDNELETLRYQSAEFKKKHTIYTECARKCKERYDETKMKIDAIQKKLDADKVSNDNTLNEECPICFEDLKPPIKIFQCSEGHIYCEICKDKPGMDLCPQCKTSIRGLGIRNRKLEERMEKEFAT